jgi:hypothetical protein
MAQTAAQYADVGRAAAPQFEPVVQVHVGEKVFTGAPIFREARLSQPSCYRPEA